MFRARRLFASSCHSGRFAPLDLLVAFCLSYSAGPFFPEEWSDPAELRDFFPAFCPYCMVLCLFHAIGLILELYKTHPSVGSWSYPEPGYLKIGSVPLYSGFMYAAVASYMCQAWRILELKLQGYPSYWQSVPLCAAIYINFFTNRYFQDLRLFLIPVVFAVFWPTRVYFTVVSKQQRHMPLVLSFVLIGFFIWIAENIATFFGAWVYPEQSARWTAVSLQKFSSWFLLVIVSFLIVADLKHVRETQSTIGHQSV